MLNLRNHLQGSDNHQLQSFNTTHRITNNVKLGAQVVNQKVFVQRQTAIYADFAYGLAIDSVSTLQLGLKAGGDLFNIDGTRFRTFNPQTTLFARCFRKVPAQCRGRGLLPSSQMVCRLISA